MIQTIEVPRTGAVGTPLHSPELVEQAACVVYEAVRGLGLSLGEVGNPTWQVATQEVKAGYRRGVRRVLDGEAFAPELHGDWVGVKSGEGWRHGTQFDAAHREHPMLRPFHELSEPQQFQYALFVKIVEVFARHGRKVK